MNLKRVPAAHVTNDMTRRVLDRVREGLAGPSFLALPALVRAVRDGALPPVLDFIVTVGTDEPVGFVGWDRYPAPHLVSGLPGVPWASWTGLAPALRGTGLLPTLRCWQAHQAETIRALTHPGEPVFLSSIATWNERSQRASAGYARREGWEQRWLDVGEPTRSARLLIWPPGIPHTCTVDPRFAADLPVLAS